MGYSEERFFPPETILIIKKRIFVLLGITVYNDLFRKNTLLINTVRYLVIYAIQILNLYIYIADFLAEDKILKDRY